MMHPEDDVHANNPFEDVDIFTSDTDEGHTEEWPKSDDDTSNKSDDAEIDVVPVTTTPLRSTSIPADVSAKSTPGTPPPEKPSRSISLIKSRLSSLAELQNPSAGTGGKGKRPRRLSSHQDITVDYGDIATAKKRVMVRCDTL